MDFLLAALWFIAGALLHKLLSSLMELGQRALYAKELLSDSLRLAVYMIEDVKAARAMKYTQLEEAKCPEEYVEFAKTVDDLAIKNWQQSFINKMISTFPKQYSGLITFEDWKGAVSTLDRKIKK